QQQVLRASPNELTQLVSALSATAPDGHARGHVGVLVAQAKPLAQATLCAVPVSVNRQVHPLGDGKGRWVALGFVQEASHKAYLLDEVSRCGRACTHPAIAVAYSAFQSHRLTGTKPERRMRFLHGFGFHRHVLEPPEGASDGSARLRPQRFHHLQPLYEAARALLAR